MTKNCEMTLVIMFFCESLKFLQLRLRCIMSWSSPVMAIMVKAPARNCLKKLLLAVHIVEEEDAGHVTVGNGAYHTGK